MDWKKVVATLDEQTKFFAAQAQKYGQMSGYFSLVEQYRRSADTASILASALRSGLEQPQSL